MLKVLVKPNKKALKWVRRGRRKKCLANCFGFFGGYVIAWQLVDGIFLDGDNPRIGSNPLSV